MSDGDRYCSFSNASKTNQANEPLQLQLLIQSSNGVVAAAHAVQGRR